MHGLIFFINKLCFIILNCNIINNHLMNKILYWSPFTSKVATVKSVINSAESINKYLGTKFRAIIVDAVNEWQDYYPELKEKKNRNCKIKP